jgi:hypothetical protein
MNKDYFEDIVVGVNFDKSLLSEQQKAATLSEHPESYLVLTELRDFSVKKDLP